MATTPLEGGFHAAVQWSLVIVLLLLILILVHRAMFTMAEGYSNATATAVTTEGFRNPSPVPAPPELLARVVPRQPAATNPMQVAAYDAGSARTAAYDTSRGGVRDVPPSEYLRWATTTRRRPDTIYDTKYARLYDRIVNDFKRKLMQYEVDQVRRNTRIEEYGRRANVLDLGCGTGWQVKKLAALCGRCVGLDQSRAMLDQARQNVGGKTGRGAHGARLVQGDMLSRKTFDEAEFTHITLFYFTVYYAPEPLPLLRNVAHWLKQGGWCVVHVVDPARFDPVLDAANPIVGISRQRYMTQRQLDSKVYLQKSLYHARFELDRKAHQATFTENIVFPERRHVRKNVHTLAMPPLRSMVRSFRKAGFKMRRVLHLVHLGYEYQYLCILQKAR